MIDHLRAADLFILDRVYTPLAHAIHDGLGARSRAVASAAFVIAAAFDSIDASLFWLKIVAPVMPVAMVVFLQFCPEPKVGCANDFRVRLQYARLFNMFAYPPLLITADIYSWVGTLAWVSAWWLASVTDRPRKPWTLFSPSLPQGARS